MKKETIVKIAWGLCLLVGVALSFKSLREPDLWWMYRTGEWMLENGQVTKSDPFSYTMQGTPWVNVKWLFEILIVGIKKVLGVEGIFVLQAAVTVGVLSLVYQSAQTIRQLVVPVGNNSKLPFVGVVLASLLLLYTIDYRLIGRPEMTSHLMTAAYLCLFWKYHSKPSRLIFCLIPLQLLWTNMHEAFGIGVVLMVGYLIATWLQYFYQKQEVSANNPPKLLSIAVLGALAVMVVNPRGYQMWLHPFNIFGQLASNQYTTELKGVFKVGYWLEIQGYLNLVFLVITTLLVVAFPWYWRSHKKENSYKITPKNWLQIIVRQFGLGNLGLALLLFYLSLTAYRNIPFFVIAATPFVAVAIELLLQRIQKPKLSYGLAILLPLAFYGAIITGKYHEWSNSRDQYGLQVLASYNPTGAADFIIKNKIKGTCFSDYLTSSYLLWKLQPDFKTYIDLRDLDIFPTDFFDEFTKMLVIPEIFEAKDSLYDFDYAVIYRPEFEYIQKYLLESNKYDLVFVDAVASVYVKSTEVNDHLIDSFGFAKHKAYDIFSDLQPIPASGVAYWLSKIVNPLYQPTDYSDAGQDVIAGAYYLGLRNPRLALARAEQALKTNVDKWKTYELFGNCYNFMAFADNRTPDSLRASYVQKAVANYNQALIEKPDYASAMISKASVLMQQGSFTGALSLLQKAEEITPNNPVALQYIAVCYKQLTFEKAQQGGAINLVTAKKWLEYSLQLNALQESNALIDLDIGIAYCTMGKCVEAAPYLQKIRDLPGLPPEEMKTAMRCINDCKL